MTFETYDVLAIRYRPMILSEMVGQDHAVNILRSQFEEKRVPRFFFISGPYGSGKTTFARMIARYVNCEGERDGIDPCLKCSKCLDYYSDYVEFNAAETRGIDDVRNLIRGAQYRPMTSNYRIFVIDEIHQLTPQAAQALLKDTEPPPPQTVFIMCTTDPEKVPPALASRGIKINLSKVEPEDTARLLAEVYASEMQTDVKDESVFMDIAVAVDGNPRNALNALESVISLVSSRKGKVDISHVVQEVSKTVMAQRPEAYAETILLSIYNGKFTRALDAVRQFYLQSSGPGVLLNTILRYQAATTNYKASDKLKERYLFTWYNKVNRKTLPSFDAMSVILSSFTLALEKSKMFLVPEQYLAMNAINTSVLAVKAMKGSAE